MIIFLHGNDSFRSHEKLMEIKKRYLAKAGDLNLIILESEDLNFESFSRQVQAVPLLASSRLLIIKNVCQANTDLQQLIVKQLAKIPETTNLVFYEDRTPDKRGALYKKLIAASRQQEFRGLSNWEMERFIRERAAKEGAEISGPAIKKLALFCGSDTGRVNQEIKKLNLFNPAISEENIEHLVAPAISGDIFKLIDELAERRQENAQRELGELLRAGKNELYILSMLHYGWRNLLLLKLAKNPSRVYLHPYVRQKISRQLDHFSAEELKNGYAQILNCDIMIKTGDQKPRLCLELLLMKLSS